MVLAGRRPATVTLRKLATLLTPQSSTTESRMSDSARMKHRPNQRAGARAVSAGMSARGLRGSLGLAVLLLASCSGAARPAGEPRAAEQRAAVSGACAPTNAAAPADSAYGKLDVLVTHVRKRNTDAYAVKSAAGIDEASFVRAHVEDGVDASLPIYRSRCDSSRWRSSRTKRRPAYRH
jgi:hypothetical protein